MFAQPEEVLVQDQPVEPPAETAELESLALERIEDEIAELAAHIYSRRTPTRSSGWPSPASSPATTGDRVATEPRSSCMSTRRRSRITRTGAASSTTGWRSHRRLPGASRATPRWYRSSRRRARRYRWGESVARSTRVTQGAACSRSDVPIPGVREHPVRRRSPSSALGDGWRDEPGQPAPRMPAPSPAHARTGVYRRGSARWSDSLPAPGRQGDRARAAGLTGRSRELRGKTAAPPGSRSVLKPAQPGPASGCTSA
jgi:hypothetical protein